MASYSEKRRAKGKSSATKSNQIVATDIDRMSMIGSINSGMSVSVLERKLTDAQQRIKQLEQVTRSQQTTIDRLYDLVSRKR